MEKKPKGYWTYDRCLEESKKYKTVNEFRNYSASAYVISKRNNWLFDFTHLEREHHPNGYWTKERCFNAAKECQTYGEFLKKYGGAYHASINNGWLKDYPWFLTKEESLHKAWTEGRCRQKMLTYEECLNESKKYTSRKEFKENSPAHYYKSKKEHWIKDFHWLKPDLDIFGKCDCVYKYYFKEYNAVYIGRTISPKRRDKEHIFNSTDTVAKFALEHNAPVPEMEILDTNLTLKEGQEREDYYINLYKTSGYVILNKAKAGSLGTIFCGKWTYENCYNEALKYETRSDFAKGNATAYNVAWKYKWLDDYTWFKEKGKHKNPMWTYESTYQEALKYKTLKDFGKGSNGAYQTAYKHHWMKDYDWLYL